MAGNLITLRRRIKSVKNTRKITQAMKTVSAAKLRRSVGELKKNRPFLEKAGALLYKPAQKIDIQEHPLFKKRDTGLTILVAISSDKGLCGAFNTHIIKKVREHYSQYQEQGLEVSFVAVGNRVTKYLKKKGFPIKNQYEAMISKLTYADARTLSTYLQGIYETEQIRAIEIIGTRFLSASKQEIHFHKLFPLTGLEKIGETPGLEEEEYIFEPSAQEIFNALLPQYVHALVYGFLLESAASEHASRMVAMDMAARNAGDVIKSLTLTLNKLRQALITKELLEIMTATEALNK